jgi:bacillithiol system protein YtxJ
MEWIHLNDEEQLSHIIEKSKEKPQVIFKHSNRCSISSVALQRMQRANQPGEIDFYFLDLIKYRSVSNKVAEVFKVRHESPQVLLIRQGKCIFHESHLSIDMHEIVDQAKAA